MTSFTPKHYQQEVLDTITKYFHACYEHSNPDVAFYAITTELWGEGSKYNPLPGFPKDMPYFCLRVPTGGGKTWLAAKAVAIVNSDLLRVSRSLILWLVPSTAIKEQTLNSLRDGEHPYASALRDAGNASVLDLEEAKSLTKSQVLGGTVVIVSTRQAFQVENEENRKVYESNGSLMQHFNELSPDQISKLLIDDDGFYAKSLANVFRLYRPFVIVDEAHNSRTELSFETLAKFSPSGIMELTATPDMDRNPSNVLHSVSAADLKAEEMIKLPIILETEADWQRCLADALARREELQQLATSEYESGSNYLRPIILIQAEPRRSNVETRNVYAVQDELITNHRVAEKHITIATGEERGIEKLESEYDGGISNPDCPVRFVITQKALSEGWDCPFAYILVSMAELRSATAVEQILGRILRQPNAKRRSNDELNQSYAFVVSRHFEETAQSLRDRLVEGAGFERKEAKEFVRRIQPSQDQQSTLFDLPYEIPLLRSPIVIRVSEPIEQEVPEELISKVSWDSDEQAIVITAPLDEIETEKTKDLVKKPTEKEAVAQGGEISRQPELLIHPTTYETLRIPQMAIRIDDQAEIFEDPEMIDYNWDLERTNADPTENELEKLKAEQHSSSGAQIDINEEEGTISVEYLKDLQRDLGLVYKPENWDENKLAVWLCRNVPDASSPHQKKLAFITRWVHKLLEEEDYDLATLNRQKFFVRTLLERRLRNAKTAKIKNAFQQSMFGNDVDQYFEVTNQFAYEFRPDSYFPDKLYNGRFGHFEFRGHYYQSIGDFDTKEEFQCAVYLDRLAQEGRIEYWARNLVRKQICSFYLQLSDRKFYPDFICHLNNGRILVVEYKGADRWTSDKAKEDRMIGEVWEKMSDGLCRFVMVKDMDWSKIEAKLG